MSDKYGFPYISYSRLKEMRKVAKLYMTEGGFDDYELWLLMVRNEADRLYAEHWHDQLEKARNYVCTEAWPCPLCVYDSGEFIAYCEMHKEIDMLEKENQRLRKKVGYEDYPGEKITTLSREEWDKAYLGEED